MKIQAIFRRIEMEDEKEKQKDVKVGMLRIASANRHVSTVMGILYRVFAGEKEI